MTSTRDEASPAALAPPRIVDRPPPCGAPAYRERHDTEQARLDEAPTTRRAERRGEPEQRPREHPFSARLDVAEIDDRGRPVPAWRALALGLSRGTLRFRSRRMCYPGREVYVAVHQIDDKPVALFGRVFSCEYDGDGTHEVLIHLDRPENDLVLTTWAASRHRR